MTFEFAPGWKNGIDGTAGQTLATPKIAQSPSLLQEPRPRPVLQSMSQVAALVEELFAEGSLSYDQFRTLSATPELRPLLGEAPEGVPAQRRLAAGRLTTGRQ